MGGACSNTDLAVESAYIYIYIYLEIFLMCSVILVGFVNLLPGAVFFILYSSTNWRKSDKLKKEGDMNRWPDEMTINRLFSKGVEDHQRSFG